MRCSTCVQHDNALATQFKERQCHCDETHVLSMRCFTPFSMTTNYQRKSTNNTVILTVGKNRNATQRCDAAASTRCLTPFSMTMNYYRSSKKNTVILTPSVPQGRLREESQRGAQREHSEITPLPR